MQALPALPADPDDMDKKPPRRVPRPAHPVQWTVQVSVEEAELIEDAAHLCRLSVSSFLRVALIEAARNPRAEAWTAIAAELVAASETPKPGRPKTKPKKGK